MGKILKILGGFLLILVLVLVAAYVVILLTSNSKIEREFKDVEVAALTVDIPSDEEAILEGRRLFTSRGCADCHGGDAGGDEFINDPVLGKFDAPNLTSGKGGKASEFEVEDWVRAVRHGIDPDGTSLLIMPAEEYFRMRDQELAYIIAFLENADPVDNENDARSLGPLGRVLILLDEVPLQAEAVDHEATPSTVEPGPTAEYGEYLALMVCSGCHGTDFKGQTLPGESTATPSLHITDEWSYEQFQTALRTGIDPDGSRLSEDMPWENVGQMTDDELAAIWAYLETL